ncbi:hypothetical protein, partial [Desulfoluna butyratoxydans]|uniref:hypothetical protein n=1 Tax=Desulfoluna butyratoxydans TaxID=231438 RepID=UPI001C5543FD
AWLRHAQKAKKRLTRRIKDSVGTANRRRVASSGLPENLRAEILGNLRAGSRLRLVPPESLRSKPCMASPCPKSKKAIDPKN